LGIFVKANRQGLGGASALALTLALASVPGSAWAQAQTQAPAALEEIVVTAERRETNLQDTPVAVTAITGDTLRALGAATIEDLQVFTPGITITNDSMAIINIRGIGTSAFGVATDPSSTVHYDGVYIPRPTTSYQDMFDVERIELLRGPQGVLFGRNSAGGTLNITSQAPTATLQGVVSATLGNYDRRTFSGTVSGPLGERVRGRLTVMKNDRDGIYSNPKTGEDYQNINRAAVRGTLSFLVSDQLDVVLRADYGRDRETGYPSLRASYPAAFALAGATIPRGRDELILDTRPRNNVENGGVSATATYVTAPLTFKSITALRASTVDQVLDVDATNLFLRNITLWERSRSFTQELQVSNNDAERLEWIAGAFYLREKARDQLQILEPGRQLALPENNVTDAAALYGQATYRVMDRTRLTAGLRYSYERKNFAYRAKVGGVDAGGEAAKASWRAWTPKLGVQYDVSDDVMAYASVTRGFKSGGFQLGDGRPFRPEYIWSYEGGVKSMLWDRRVRANLSVFYYDYTDLQVVEYINGVATTTNAGKATLKGGELEIVARPVAGLDLTATAAYLDAQYDRYFDQGVSLAGYTLPNAPKWNLTFAAAYRFEFADGHSLTLRGDVGWRDRVYFKPNNLRQFSEDPNTLVNARATFAPAGGVWEMSIFARNLTDARYATYKTVGTDATGVSNPALPLSVFGEPRQYGVQMLRRF
jgi:iron complex outermembrane receptor protein